MLLVLFTFLSLYFCYLFEFFVSCCCLFFSKTKTKTKTKTKLCAVYFFSYSNLSYLYSIHAFYSILFSPSVVILIDLCLFCAFYFLFFYLLLLLLRSFLTSFLSFDSIRFDLFGLFLFFRLLLHTCFAKTFFLACVWKLCFFRDWIR